MKAVKIGNRVEIYNDMVMTFDELPPKAYIVRFDSLSGFYLEEYKDIEVREEKIYGAQSEKAKKILATYLRFERNLGVILSGEKGIGKSLFARYLAVQTIKKGIPVLVIDRYVPEISSYLEKLDQRVMLLFDEFDKTFGSISPLEGEQEPQTELLSLFDGIPGGRKLFVITCNEIKALSDYIVNRPGRFHYHLRFDYPSEEEIRNYLTDKLDKKYYGEIDTIIGFSRKVDLNYDCLRAIVQEINSGEKFKTAIADLNILNIIQDKYDILLYFKNGRAIGASGVELDFFNNQEKVVSISEDNFHEIIEVHFYTQDCRYNPHDKYAVIEAKKLRLTYDEEYSAELVKEMKALIPDYLTISKVRGKSLHYRI